MITNQNIDMNIKEVKYLSILSKFSIVKFDADGHLAEILLLQIVFTRLNPAKNKDSIALSLQTYPL